MKKSIKTLIEMFLSDARFPDEKFWTKDGQAIHPKAKGTPPGATGLSSKDFGSRDDNDKHTATIEVIPGNRYYELQISSPGVKPISLLDIELEEYIAKYDIKTIVQNLDKTPNGYRSSFKDGKYPADEYIKIWYDRFD